MDRTLYEMLFLSEQSLQQIIGNRKVSGTEIYRLAVIFDAFAIAIDSEFLQQMHFSHLLEGKAPFAD